MSAFRSGACAGHAHRFLPLLGIGGAIAIHIIYNNVVNMLSGTTLLVVAIAIGVGGAALIALQIVYGLRQEKAQFTPDARLADRRVARRAAGDPALRRRVD